MLNKINQVMVYTWGSIYVNWLDQQGLSGNTVRAYVADLGVFIYWFEIHNNETFRPDIITAIDLREWRKQAIKKERIKPATWNRRRSSMIAFCQWARFRGYITTDPMENIPAAKEEQLPPRWIMERDQKRVLRTIERRINAALGSKFKTRAAIRDRAMVALMLFAGLREGEVAALDVGDIELKERSGAVSIRDGKGGKSRVVPLNHEARLALGMWFESEGVGVQGYGEFNLFTTGGQRCGADEKRLTARTIQRRIGAIGEEAKLKLTPHMLRHTFAKRLVDSGTPLTVIQRLMGHARIETTARYVEPGWEDFELAVEGI